MAKKKSKTQKLKKNLKTKQKKIQKKILEKTEELKVIKNSGATTAPKTKKAIKTPTNKKDNGGKKKLVPKDQVKYNISIKTEEKERKTLTKPPFQKKYKEKDKKAKSPIIIKKDLKKPEKIEQINFEETKEEKQEILPIVKSPKPKKDIANKLKIFFATLFTAIAVFFKKVVINIKEAERKHKKNKAQQQAKRELKLLLKQKQEEVIEITEDEQEELDSEEIKKSQQAEKKERIKKKNIFVRLLYEIISNRHIFFNAILILFFIVLLIGLNRIEISKGSIIYISLISIFLIGIAISYNKYLSGKLFTILLCTIMGFAIYRIQYTYDFIRNLNSTIYEYKTYYVVTFNNTQNKSIYNINNKKVGLYKENTINIERKLDTKLDNISYIEYDDLNDLFNDFYNQKFRAILVNDNQYKYMTNHINSNSRDVKILYEFKANAKK